MAVMTVRTLLQAGPIRAAAADVVRVMASAHGEDGAGADADKAARRTAALLDKYVKKAWQGAQGLRAALSEDASPQELFERAREHVRALDYHWNVMGWARPIDAALERLTAEITAATEGIVVHMPGAVLHVPHSPHASHAPQLLPHFIAPRAFVGRLAQPVERLRALQADGWAGAPSPLADLCVPELQSDELARLLSAVAAGRDGHARPFREQLWRLQDLAAGGTLWMLELLLAAASAPAHGAGARAPDTHALFAGTFDAVVGKRGHRELRRTDAGKHGVGVLLREALQPPGREPSTVPPPPPPPPLLVEKVLMLAANVLKGSSGPHVDEAVGCLRAYAGALPSGDPLRALAEDAAFKLQPPSGRPLVAPPRAESM
jgi:hypothetical protein